MPTANRQYKSCAAGNFSVWLRACFSTALAATRSSHLLNSIDAVTSSLAALGRSCSQLVPLLPGPGSAAPRDDLAARAARATALVHIGELSAAGRALVAEPLAPGTAATLAELRDPSRRPPTPYAQLPQDIAAFRADSPCPFPLPAFVACLRTARRGAAAGPSGATNEHLRILLDDEGDTQLLHGAACRLAHAYLPPPVLAALRIGRMTALQKPNGRGIRALVVGDVLRRLVGRALAQAFAPHFQRACLPHQFGLSTRAGTEALARVLRAATELDPRATVLSVDAVGAFDHVSREAMLSALLRHPDLRPLVPFARQFYLTPSSYTWTDDSGRSHVIGQGEGGEQGDPLMPALYALAQQPAFCEVQAQLRDGEAIFAFLDDTYVVAPRTGYAQCTTPSALHCGDMPVLSSTVARPVYGMWLGRSRQASPTCRVIPMLSYGRATGPFAWTSRASWS